MTTTGEPQDFYPAQFCEEFLKDRRASLAEAPVWPCSKPESFKNGIC
jgi:hypothetical protein